MPDEMNQVYLLRNETAKDVTNQDAIRSGGLIRMGYPIETNQYRPFYDCPNGTFMIVLRRNGLDIARVTGPILQAEAPSPGGWFRKAEYLTETPVGAPTASVGLRGAFYRVTSPTAVIVAAALAGHTTARFPDQTWPTDLTRGVFHAVNRNKAKQSFEVSPEGGADTASDTADEAMHSTVALATAAFVLAGTIQRQVAASTSTIEGHLSKTKFGDLLKETVAELASIRNVRDKTVYDTLTSRRGLFHFANTQHSSLSAWGNATTDC